MNPPAPLSRRQTTAVALALLLGLAGCATPGTEGRVLSRNGEANVEVTPVVFPMRLDDVRRLLRDGRSSSDVIAELDRTRTVLDIKPSEVAALLAEGIPADVLDWIHQRQLDALGDTWKTELARREQEHLRELERVRREAELRGFSRYPYGSPFIYPYNRFYFGPGWRF